YHNPAIGWPADIQMLSATQAREFFDKYYTASNMAVAVVGDVNPEEIRRLAEKYFGPMPLRPTPPQPHLADPPQHGPRRIEIQGASQPVVMIGFKRPEKNHPDSLALDLAASILGSGRLSLINKSLIEDQ